MKDISEARKWYLRRMDELDEPDRTFALGLINGFSGIWELSVSNPKASMDTLPEWDKLHKKGPFLLHLNFSEAELFSDSFSNRTMISFSDVKVSLVEEAEISLEDIIKLASYDSRTYTFLYRLSPKLPRYPECDCAIIEDTSFLGREVGTFMVTVVRNHFG